MYDVMCMSCTVRVMYMLHAHASLTGVQKMETVGKTYMAAAGIPGTRKDDAIACVEMGMEMVQLMSQYHIDGEPIAVRVGINSGVVISGM